MQDESSQLTFILSAEVRVVSPLIYITPLGGGGLECPCFLIEGVEAPRG